MMKPLMTSLLVLAHLVSVVCAAEDGADRPAYLLVTGWYKDLAQQRAYSGASVPILYADDSGYQMSIRGFPGDNIRVLEGDWNPGRVVLVKFSSEDHVKDYWWGKDHQAAWRKYAPSFAVDAVQVDAAPAGKDMSTDKENTAYLIFLKGEITDKETYMRDYVPHAGNVFKKYGGMAIVSSPRNDMELLYGTLPDGWLSFIEFPSVKAMRDFWASDEYQKLSEVRKKTGVWTVLEIVPPE